MIHTTRILAFFDKNNLQIVTNFASVLFNTKVKALNHDGHILTFRNYMLVLLLQHNTLKGLEGEANMSTVLLLQSADVNLLVKTL